MGRGPDQLEHQIREHREAISRRIDGLQKRVQDDLDRVSAESRMRADEAVGGARQAFDVESRVRERPMTTLAGAFGAGVLLGIVTDNANGGRQEAPRYQPAAQRDEGSLLGGFAGSLWALLGPGLQEEIRESLRNAVRSLTGREARREPERATDYERSSMAHA
ncbi:MAG TPA: hypothetical protein VNN10_07170 [Dehalococcoidia bacterium]|nr:hypothetical protein [Dehalococcoidia bacterium]